MNLDSKKIAPSKNRFSPSESSEGLSISRNFKEFDI